MESANKRQKRGSVSEEDVSILLQRYSATKVLALLREVAQSSSGVKIDWDALVKKTATGITNAREYQMVWRHIAYRHALAEKVDDGAEPMDDDSDLEYELEATPDVSADTMTEATACVKVLSASGLPSEANVQNCSTVEAPLSTNTPNRQFSKSLSDYHAAPSVLQGSNITVPISVPKLPSPAAPSGKGGEVSSVNGSSNSNIPPRRKRKPWLEEEDSELIDAVKKFGEGNWTTILKEGFFKGDRTASQLAQRWAILKKKQNNLTIGPNTSSHLSEAQLAANRAIDMAFKDTTMTVGNGAAGTNMNPPTINTSNGDKQPSNNHTSQSPKSQSHLVGGIPKLIAPSATTKPRVPPKNPVQKSMVIADTSMVTATAMAAGARVASPSDAASMLKAFQANNAIHIKSSMASTSNPFSCTPVSGHRNISHPAIGPARHLPSPSTVPTSHATGIQPVRANYVRPSVLSTAQHLPKVSVLPTLPNRANGLLPTQPSKATTSPAGMASGRSNNPASSSANGPPVGNRITSEENKTRPLLASSKTQNAEAKINPAPVLSSAELVVSSQVLAAEKSLFVAGVGKKKDGVEGNGCCDDGIKNIRNQMVLDSNITDNLPCAEGRVEELSGKHEKVVKREPGILLSSKDGNSSRSLEVTKELKAAVKLVGK